MKLTTTQVDVWSTEIDDTAGGLARTLRAIADYGADLDYVQAERSPATPGKGRLFVAAMNQHLQLDQVTDVGLRRAVSRPTLKIEGSNGSGTAAKITKAIAGAGVTMKGFSSGVIGHHFVCYVEFDTALDCEKADAALKALEGHSAWAFWHRPGHKAA